MAHTFDTSIRYPDDATTFANGTTITCNITVNANGTGLAVGLLYAATANNRTGGALTANNATSGNATMSQANTVQKAVTSPEGSVEAWYLQGPIPTGTVTISIPNSANLNIKVVAASFKAAANYTSRYDTANGANATGANPSVSVTTSANGCALFSVTTAGHSNVISNFTNDTGTNLYKFDLGAWGGASQYLLQANSGTNALGYTASSEDWGAVAVAFKEEAIIFGTTNATLDVITLSSTGTVTDPLPEVNGTVDATLDALTCASTAIVRTFILADSANIAAGGAANTTAQLTAPANKTTGNFQEGKISDDTNPLASLDLTTNKYTELEWCLQSTAAVTTNHVYTFRVTDNGTPINTYAANATWTIGTTTSNGTVDVTLDSLARDIQGTVTDPVISGTADVTLDDLAKEILAAVDVAGQTDQALDALTSDATTAVEVSGNTDAALDDITAISEATVAVAADVQQSLADAGLSAAATVEVWALTDTALDDLTPDIQGIVEDQPSILGSVSQTLDALTQELAGTIAVAGSTDAAFDAATLSGAAEVVVAGSTDTSLDALTLAGEGTVALVGTTDATLDAVTLSSEGTTSLGVNATVSATLAALTLSASAAKAPFRLQPSSYISANAAGTTTGQLAPPSGKTVNGYFDPGRISDDTNPLPLIDLTVNRYTEVEWSVMATGLAVQGGTYQFRTTVNGTAVNTYPVTPAWTVYDTVNATVNATLDVSLSAQAYPLGPGEGFVDQTLEDVSLACEAVAGPETSVDITLASLNDITVAADTSGIGGGTPDGYHYYFGAVSEVYTQIVSRPWAANHEEDIVTLAPDLGEWYVMARAYNADGESDNSNELFVVVPAIRGIVEDITGIGALDGTVAAVGASVGRVGVAGTAIHTVSLSGVVIAAAGVRGTVAQAPTLSVSSAGAIAVSGTVNSTIDAVTCQAVALKDVIVDGTLTLSGIIAGAVGVAGVTTGTLADATGSAVATALVSAVTDAAVDPVTPDILGDLGDLPTITAQVDATLDVVQFEQVATVEVAGIVDATLDTEIVQNATVEVQGAVDATLTADLASAATVQEPEVSVAWLDAILDEAQIEAAAVVEISGAVDAVLDELATSQAGHVGYVRRAASNVLLDGSDVRWRS